MHVYRTLEHITDHYSVYREIGDGTCVALAKLAEDHRARTGHAFTIAIDAPIWLYQIQASEGGASPAIRTLYYRLVRLLLYGIQAVFVFDGPDKPPFKRNAATSRGSPKSAFIAKRLIELFGFMCHEAPGEAEAECARLQSSHVVDAVLSEDIDTLAFGCTLSLRQWPAESGKGKKTTTHVAVYDAQEIAKGKSRLTREGMILVALMSGGDYLPAGIPGCGPKVACEAARGDFGHYLCEIPDGEDQQFADWREELCNELRENTSGYFKTKHKAVAAKVPDTFPDRSVLRYHMRPSVSSREQIEEVRRRLASCGQIDVKGLRDFVDEQFSWKHLSGAKKFLRQISPALLAHKLRTKSIDPYEMHGMDIQTEHEERLVQRILSRRTHFSVDGIPELKVAYTPALVADFDLDQQSDADEDDESALSSDADDLEITVQPASTMEEASTDAPPQKNMTESPAKASRRKRRSKLAAWDPKTEQTTWLLESFVRRGAPQSLVQWESDTRHAAELKARQANHKSKTAGGMQAGALEGYLRVMKPGSILDSRDSMGKEAIPPSTGKVQESVASSRPIWTPPAPASNSSNHALSARAKSERAPKTAPKKVKPSVKQQRKTPVPLGSDTNPWTIASLRRKTQEEKEIPGSSQKDEGRQVDTLASWRIDSSNEQSDVMQSFEDAVGFSSGMVPTVDLTMGRVDD